MNNLFLHHRSVLLVALLASALAVACGSSDTETQQAAASGTGAAGASGGSGGDGATGGAGASGGGGAGGGDGTCHEGRDCAGGFCAAYQLEPLCGGEPDNSFMEDCMTDADCAAGGADQICDDKLCIIPHGGAQTPLHCRKGCTAAADCGPGLSCNAAHHCEPAACTQPAECGSNFTCDAAGMVCAPKQCMSDAECDGYCVNGRCSASIGQCFRAVP